MTFLKEALEDITKYPSAIGGLIIIIFLFGLAAYTLITIPYDDAIRLWQGGGSVWADNPRTAWPRWYNWITSENLSETIVLRSDDPQINKTVEPAGEGVQEVSMTFPVTFPYDSFPQEIILFVNSKYVTKQPHIDLTWITPDGRELRAGSFSADRSFSYRFNERGLQRRIGGLSPERGLFAVPDSDPPVPLKGNYELQFSGFLFEEDADVDARLVVYGEVHGIAGTDHRRRDLSVALLWGTPIALAFGLLAAVGTTITTMIIAAFGVWFGGMVDAVIQRITEVNLILPFLPILIMIGTFYSRSIWLMLGATIVLSIFGGAIKQYRAIFLQVKSASYIEAARAYGAGDIRIIFRYLVPRIVPLLVPQLVVLVPTFVFLEASLAVLGLGDPVLPTWGKLIDDARSQGALFNGYYYWVVQPAALLMMVGLGFAMMGFALDRIINPRLREL
ncbi:MAG TPA: ABC transporter permease [Candidatus Sulfomarinibacteraceae bacterium]|nr:ABC transporter permease [Candidatus Sulfomarinibacteraceae bacterium]